MQRRASKCVWGAHGFEMEYEDTIKLLYWPTFEERRTLLSSIECYKTIHILNGLGLTNDFDCSNSNTNLRRNRSLILTIPFELIILNIHSLHVLLKTGMLCQKN